MNDKTYDEVAKQAKEKYEAGLRKERERERRVRDAGVCPACKRPFSVRVGEDYDYWAEQEKRT